MGVIRIDSKVAWGTALHELGQVTMEIDDLLLLVRIGQRAAKPARLHALLNELHVVESCTSTEPQFSAFGSA
jgi:hypothetical protein